MSQCIQLIVNGSDVLLTKLTLSQRGITVSMNIKQIIILSC